MTRSWSFLKGGPRQGRFLRYVLVLAMGWVGILILAAAFYFLTPKTYTSGFTLILPGAGSASSVNLDSLGQATSNTSSPFGSHSLSPTENYKRLLQSYRLRGKVAAGLNLPIEAVPAPSIKLANQTKLMYVSVKADSPEAAKQLAETWLVSFERELNALRNEEQTLRDLAYRDTLAGFEEAVRETQAKIIAFQSEHGLISVDQFREIVGQTEALRIELERAEAELAVSQSEVTRLSEILDISEEQAIDILTLLSDTAFQSMVEAHSKATVTQSELSDMFGANHPEVIAARNELSGLNRGLFERGSLLIGFEAFATMDRAYYTSKDQRSALIAKLVDAAVKFSGAQKRCAAIREQLENTQARVEQLAVPATELDSLLRDHQVAETVFASALARIDTNRTDVFASYPLTQTVETPGLPDSPATPSKKFIALGTIAGMLFYAIGLALLWIRLPIIRALLKTL
ncbi:MAG: GumC family protein [Henriciella sp.]